MEGGICLCGPHGPFKGLGLDSAVQRRRSAETGRRAADDDWRRGDFSATVLAPLG